MFTLIALAALATEPTPVGPELMEAVLASGELTSVCDTYGNLVGMIGDLGLDPEAELIFVDVADAYLIVNAEGDEYRFDPEARDALVGWLHTSCA